MENIVLFGTGSKAEQFYIEFNTKVNIIMCLDNRPNKDYFHGIKICEPNKENVSLGYVVVASSFYLEISEQLISYGLNEFDDFNCSDCYNKKISVLHGNCHMDVVKQYLKSSQEFDKVYGIYPNPLIQNNKQGYIKENILNHCDLFIHQDIRTNNAYGYKLSDEYILGKLPEKAIKITMPNLFGLGYGFFPQYFINDHNPSLNDDKNGMFPNGDININNFIKAGLNISDIIYKINSNEIYSEVEVVDNFESSIHKIKEREKNWDIKILDFILYSYKKYKLFYDVGHPTNIIMKEISKQILINLGLNYNDIKSDLCMNQHEDPVYPCVGKYLNLDWVENEIIRVNSPKKMNSNVMDIIEYIKQYIMWCYDYY